MTETEEIKLKCPMCQQQLTDISKSMPFALKMIGAKKAYYCKCNGVLILVLGEQQNAIKFK